MRKEHAKLECQKPSNSVSRLAPEVSRNFTPVDSLEGQATDVEFVLENQNSDDMVEYESMFAGPAR